MDLSHLPFVTYFVDWQNVAGTYILGVLGLGVSVSICIVCWRQIRNQDDIS
jgi:hypothetical protein